MTKNDAVMAGLIVMIVLFTMRGDHNATKAIGVALYLIVSWVWVKTKRDE